MKLTRLGRSGLLISQIGLGSWAIGGVAGRLGWGPQADSDSVATIHEAIDAGINWIDTAAVYGGGHSEEVVGIAIAGLAEPPLIFTKCGRVLRDDGTVAADLSAESIRSECEHSLRRLGIEAIDLYQIHWPTPAEQLESAWATLAELKAEGKVRHIGVSNCDAQELEACERTAPVESLQPPYSLIRRQVEDTALPWCGAHDAGVIAYAPMYSGLLTGAMTAARAASLPETDWRSRDSEFQQPKLSANLGLVDRLRELGRAQGLTPGQVAIAWVLEHQDVSGVIVGARSPGQIGSFAAVSDLPHHVRAAGL